MKAPPPFPLVAFLTPLLLRLSPLPLLLLFRFAVRSFTPVIVSVRMLEGTSPGAGLVVATPTKKRVNSSNLA